MQNNLALLTQSHTAIAAKKRARRDQIKEVIFDDHARRQFLTGFHKRKLAKADAARKKAIEREKQERLESRREQRRMLRERAKENAEEVEMAYGALIANDDGVWSGISGTPDEKGKQKEEEYEDEELLATVTVVEDFDPDSFIHGPPLKTNPASHQFLPVETKAAATPRDTMLKKKKSKPKKIRYETKDARKTERTKQRARRTEKAELAGGKASRKKFSNALKKKGGSKRS
ncbi:hypothetical protein BDZ94DRAFT_1160885 [Collybia nuda]|uniref:Nucleolar protein 12 n=1 Tax=Collybia nuda TaxID=64659 RepID=A0A9P6CGG1_9AGAR|nr:hypothetical protein BDZ94DRAFT_1160885 [Collybia nuda]